MNNQNFQRTLELAASPKDVFKRISQVDLWWAKNFKGKSEVLGDMFSVHFGDTYVAFQISESVSDKKVVWNIADCNLRWIDDKKERKNAEIVFDIIAKGPIVIS